VKEESRERNRALAKEGDQSFQLMMRWVRLTIEQLSERGEGKQR
jgi:hypothetical protein